MSVPKPIATHSINGTHFTLYENGTIYLSGNAADLRFEQWTLLLNCLKDELARFDISSTHEDVE